VWASWCAPCKQELPMLDDAVERLRTNGVEVVAVSVDESAADAEEFLQSRSTWSLVVGHDPGGRSLRRLEVTKMPTSFVIDRKGVIRAVYPESYREDFRMIETQLVALGTAP
jgi:cytochrome c biogenesis protein CcmG, thiol:disulfide interchange protein DsbE